MSHWEMEFVREQLSLDYMHPMPDGAGGGCINEGRGYTTDHGDIFVKSAKKPDGARLIFDGELASLQAIAATGTVRCPRPMTVAVCPRSGHAVLVTEFVPMRELSAERMATLGKQVARMHLNNGKAIAKADAQSSRVGSPEKQSEPVRQFGFHVPTCCGSIPQSNTWHDDWLQFLATEKLQPQVDMLEREHGDRELLELWPRVQRRLPELLTTGCQPALLHGDLWRCNVAETDGTPVIFDPASFYGDAEFELGIVHLFGGFDSAFYNAYHALQPRRKGHRMRIKLYKLFHSLNHWNHFGDGYREGSLKLMRSLADGK